MDKACQPLTNPDPPEIFLASRVRIDIGREHTVTSMEIRKKLLARKLEQGTTCLTFKLSIVSVLPDFNQDGLLPPGDYPLTFDELRSSFLVAGPSGQTNWNSTWRARLVDNLEVLVKQLWTVGIDEVFIDGSFVEDKDHPNDIDGYFHCDTQRFASRVLHQELNLLDPHKVWTWEPQSRVPWPGTTKRQLPMWVVYNVELYPHYPGLIAGQDNHGASLEFPAFFRKTRGSGAKKGIIKMIRRQHD